MPLFLRIFIVVAWVFLIPTSLSAQLAPYYSHQTLYDEAIDLFEKGHYGAAQKKVEEFMAAEKSARGHVHNDLHANAHFVRAVSAYHLGRGDAEALLRDYLLDFSNNTKVSLVNYYLGKLYFDRKDYLGAIRPLLAAYQSGNLSVTDMDELTFLLAYCYFMDNQNQQATRYFSAVGGRQNPRQEDARYYLSVILYQDKDYEGAYLAFKELEKSPKYGKEIRIYLANTLLKLKRYDELYVLADELITDRRLRGKDIQVYYVVANASFERQDFPRTVEYFKQYTTNKGKMQKTDNFRYGYAHYKMNQYPEAIPVFKRALGGNDSLEQVASYYLGFCYLEEKDEQNARFAFKKAAEESGISSNPQIAEDALYQYAKVSFATENYSDAIDAITNISSKYPNAPYIPEVQAMMGEAFLYTRNYPRSIKYFETILQSNPNPTPRIRQAYQQVCYYYGLENFERGRYQQAEDNFRKAVDNNYDATIALNSQYWLGESRYRRGDFAGSRSAYQTYLSARNVSRNEFYAQAFYGIAWTHFKEKNYASALQGFSDFLAKGGRSADKNLVVDAYLRSGTASLCAEVIPMPFAITSA
jgi:TolA-binding protein